MTVIIYANHCEEELLTEKEYLELIESDTKDAIDCERYDLGSFLGDVKNYSYEDVFNLTPSDKEEVLDEFREYAREQVEEDLEMYWKKYEIEI